MRAVVALSLLAASAAHAQQMDMAVMQKWAAADVIRYHIVGVYQARTHIASDGSGQADITDGLTVDLTWKLSESKLVGQPTFQNVKTVVRNVGDRSTNCLPPVLRGDYEHFDVLSIKEDNAGGLELEVKTTWPVVEVVQFCTGKFKAIPGKTETVPEPFGVVSPMAFAMPLPDSDTLRVSADKKSLITKKNGWTWTLTPTILPGR
jgi:hypothetical protein